MKHQDPTPQEIETLPGKYRRYIQRLEHEVQKFQEAQDKQEKTRIAVDLQFTPRYLPNDSKVSFIVGDRGEHDRIDFSFRDVPRVGIRAGVREVEIYSPGMAIAIMPSSSNVAYVRATDR